MKKITFVSLSIVSLIGLYSCCGNKEGKTSDLQTFVSKMDSLANQPITETKVNAELLWKFGRIGGFCLSPDQKSIVYTVTRYSISENKGYIVNSCSKDELSELKVKITAYINNIYDIPAFIMDDPCLPEDVKNKYQALQKNNETVEQYRKSRGEKPKNMTDEEWVGLWDEWYQENSSIPYQQPYVKAVKDFLGITPN